jgi:membrane-bound lytic murein transglycosylase B
LGCFRSAAAARSSRTFLRMLSACGLAAAIVLGGCTATSGPPPAPLAASEPSADEIPTPAPAPAPEVAPAPPPPTPADFAAYHVAGEKGWGWLVSRLVDDGIPLGRAAAAFADDRIPAFDGLYFSPDPREPYSRYRSFLRPRSVARAERCAAAYAPALDAAERIHGVDASVIAAILHVETSCGANTGRSIVLHRLARLAMANEPHNVARNLAKWTGRSGRIDPVLAEKIRARARYLDGIFYPQVVATFEVAARNGVGPLDIIGSSAGAFGFPQFLPLNYIAFGTDGNGDGRVSLYDPDDAVASAARFLASYGWHPGMTRSEKREVIRHYNRSDPYIDTVLRLADRIAASGVLQGVHGVSTADVQPQGDVLPVSTAPPAPIR